MPYGARHIQGKAAVASNGIGPELRKEALIHTDGQSSHGGVATFIVGPRGGGKTTLLTQYANGVLHYPITVRDRAYSSKLYRETVAYRVRKMDYWNTFFPSYWEKAFPDWKPKPVVMHNYVNNDYKFVTDTHGHVSPLDMEECEVIEYADSSELILDNFVKGAINLVCEPNEYFIPGDILKSIHLRKLQFKMKVEEETDENPESLDNIRDRVRLAMPSGDLMSSPERKEAKKIQKKYKQQPAPPPVFWFELTERILELKPQHEFLSIFIDESHQVFPDSPRQEHWHLVGWYSNTTLDQRRMNVSLFAVSHGVTLIDYRVKNRMDFQIYMPGAKLDSNSMIHNQSLISSLVKGEYILEKPGVKFGIDYFDRFVDQPPVVIADGMQNYT